MSGVRVVRWLFKRLQWGWYGILEETKNHE
jgi:hypothetical protein